MMVQYQMPADRFWFTGPVPNEDLAAFYRTASAYISLSEHEGFCVPLVEAMAADVPVLAYAAGAVPETLCGRGHAVRAEGPGVRGGVAGRHRVRSCRCGGPSLPGSASGGGRSATPACSSRSAPCWPISTDDSFPDTR